MESPRPLVSVILPTWNRAALTAEAVRSVVAQTWADWELLVVDDGSTDDTVAVVRDIGDRRIKLLPGSHVGRPSAVRNRGLGEVRGTWVAFLDSDDRWHPGKLALQLEAHAANRRARWSYTGRRMIDGDGQVLPDDRFKRWRPVGGDIFRALLRHDAMVALPTVMVEATLIAAAGKFDDTLALAEDYDLWLRLAQHSPVLCLDRPLADVRVHAQSTTRHNPLTNLSFAEVYDRIARTHHDAGVRRVARAQRAYYLTFLARQLRDRGRRAAALGVSARAVLAAPASWRTWWSLAESLVGSGKPTRPGGS